ncbi:MAG: zinc metallopeptidase [Verrucomicrobiota bacterium]|nr:zinc metallopeptidase [Verrucomicrobiota bacterium]
MLNWLILIIFPMLLAMWAQFRVMSVFGQYSKVPSRGRISGRDAAEYVMRKAGIYDVEIISSNNFLGDHYDPTQKRLVLSEANYNGTSLAALGIAAHEAGHAIQHARSYAMLKLRMQLVPITMVASNMLPFIIIGGMLFHATGLIILGVIAYMILTLFQLITLPVEFDASNRAKVELVGLGIIQSDELVGVKKTLDAAAWTYVAAFVASLGNLIYLITLLQNDRE